MPYQRNRDLSDQEIFDACCSRDDSRDGIEGPVTSYYSQECVDSKWPMSKDAALPPLGLSSTPQSSWQTYTEPVTPDNPWVFRPHVPGPPDEPLTLKPYVPRILHNIHCGTPPRRPQLHRSDSEILTHFDEDISSIRDGYTAWVVSDAAATRNCHIVNKSARGIAPAFRKASEKKSMLDNSKPNRQLEQTRISILSWNPGPRRGTPGAIEKHIAGKWHIIAPEEAVEYLQHEYLTTHFYISHFAGCGILFNKDTFHSDLRVSSVFVYNTKSGQQVIKEGQNGCVLQAATSRGDFANNSPATASLTSL